MKLETETIKNITQKHTQDLEFIKRRNISTEKHLYRLALQCQACTKAIKCLTFKIVSAREIGSVHFIQATVWDMWGNEALLETIVWLIMLHFAGTLSHYSSHYGNFFSSYDELPRNAGI